MIKNFAFCLICIGAVLVSGRLSADNGTEVYLGAFGRDWPKTEFSNHTVLAQEFLTGGPAKDGIPAISSPQIEALSNGVATGWAHKLSAEEPVIVVSLNGQTRAYPLEIMLWHEIVNDTVGGVPVVVTFCPLCNVAVVFKREVQGKLLDFGTTGLLRKSNLVMYDRQTESWWQQFSGKAVVGSWAGTRLAMVPSRVQSFAKFAQENPSGEIVEPADPDMRAYGQTPYAAYDSHQEPSFLKGAVDTAPLRPMDPVIVIRGEKVPVAISENYLRAVGKLEFDDLVISWKPGMSSVLDRRDLHKGRDIGQVKVFRRGQSLVRPVLYSRTFAFVFRSFFPSGLIVGRCVGEEMHPHADCRT